MLVNSVDYSEPVLARLGENRGERVGREVLEFIDVQEEIAAVFGRLVGSTHGGKLDAGDEK